MENIHSPLWSAWCRVSFVLQWAWLGLLLLQSAVSRHPLHTAGPGASTYHSRQPYNSPGPATRDKHTTVSAQFHCVIPTIMPCERRLQFNTHNPVNRQHKSLAATADAVCSGCLYSMETELGQHVYLMAGYLLVRKKFVAMVLVMQLPPTSILFWWSTIYTTFYSIRRRTLPNKGLSLLI